MPSSAQIMDENKAECAKGRLDDSAIGSRSVAKASLLRLPAELRNRIYYYVLGGRTVHIGYRACRAHERGVIPPKGAEDVPGFEGASHTFVKTTYAVCDNPHVDHLAYEASKLVESEIPEELLTDTGEIIIVRGSPHVIVDYATLHRSCFDALSDFMNQEYATGFSERHDCYRSQSDTTSNANDSEHSAGYESELSDQSGGDDQSDDSSRTNADEMDDDRHTGFCSTCCGQARVALATWGPPKSGLIKCHAKSSLDLRLLQVCRQIYSETSVLPYSMNSFAFQNWEGALIFAGQTLNRRQSRAIQSLHLWHPLDMEHIGYILEALEGVQTLRLWEYIAMAEPAKLVVNHELDLYRRISMRQQGALVSAAHVMVGEDTWSDHPHHPSRAERRRQAEQIEKVFMAPVPDAYEGRDDAEGLSWPRTREEWDSMVGDILNSSEKDEDTSAFSHPA